MDLTVLCKFNSHSPPYRANCLESVGAEMLGPAPSRYRNRFFTAMSNVRLLLLGGNYAVVATLLPP